MSETPRSESLSLQGEHQTLVSATLREGFFLFNKLAETLDLAVWWSTERTRQMILETLGFVRKPSKI